MTTALAIVRWPSHSFPNFTALIAAVASNVTANEKTRTRAQKRSAGAHVERRIDCPPVTFSRDCHNLHFGESKSAGGGFEECADPGDHRGRRAVDLFDDLLDLGAGRGIEVEIPPRRIGAKFRGGHRAIERRA